MNKSQLSTSRHSLPPSSNTARHTKEATKDSLLFKRSEKVHS